MAKQHSITFGENRYEYVIPEQKLKELAQKLSDSIDEEMIKQYVKEMGAISETY